MTVDTKELIYILDNTPSEQNIMLVGKHGIGKSRILEDYYSSKGQKVVTLFLGQMSDPGDLIGLPKIDEKAGKTDFMLPYWFPVDNKPVVLFLDELNRARPEVLQTIMDLTLNRKLAGKSLPEGSRIISAVNNGTEYQLTDLDPALVSRFNIYEFVPSVEDWLTWAEKEGLDPRIISFISENPEYLDEAESSGSEGDLEKTPDRRAWERASKIIKNFTELTEKEKPIVGGITGARTASIFFRFVNENKIPSAKKILCGNFEDVSCELKKLSAAEFTLLNKSLFRFTESLGKDGTDSALIMENLKKYFDFLGAAGLKELQSHFASLCSADVYPVTLNLITTKAQSLYDEIMNMVLDV